MTINRRDALALLGTGTASLPLFTVHAATAPALSLIHI